MSKSSLIVVTLLTLTLAFALVGQQHPASTAGAHLGTWQLVSTKYGVAKEFSAYPTDRRRVKMLTASHFVWVDYGTDNKKVDSTAGGSYTLVGDQYTETIEFAGAGMEAYLGKKQAFTIKIDGSKLTQSGQLSDGLKIEEVWRRVN